MQLTALLIAGAVVALGAGLRWRVVRKYGQPGPVYRYESHVAEAVFAELLSEAGVQVVTAAGFVSP